MNAVTHTKMVFMYLHGPGKRQKCVMESHGKVREFGSQISMGTLKKDIRNGVSDMESVDGCGIWRE